jgi:predicted AAA+ superfamily ATPase
MSNRYLYNQIKERILENKAIVIYGPRQVGKTTLVKKLLNGFNQNDVEYLSGDDPKTQALLDSKGVVELKEIFKNKKIIFIDEAQYINNIGITVKLIVDQIPELKLFLTGSSSFELRSQIAEPMTGRTNIFHMYPMSLSEISEERNIRDFEKDIILSEMLVYGGYPGVHNSNKERKKEVLTNLLDEYLLKDLLNYDRIKKSNMLMNLVKLLAQSVGSEVSYGEISNTIGLDILTVQKYIDLLEQSFIVFTVHPYLRNIKKEIRKSRKIFFYDNGILNALKNDFSEFSTRSDKGALFENFMISERIKRNAKNKYRPNIYFWRSKNESEVDYIEEIDGKLFAFEFKSNEKLTEVSKVFQKSYNATAKTINLSNFREFLE